MSGHSKWSNIKHKKGIADAKKGAAFTKLARELTVATRQGGGGDPSSNYHLRLAVEKARQANMKNEAIERAIKKGLGTDAESTALEETAYEGYGPGGAAIMILGLTDNRNRTASEVRTLFSRNGGNLAESGSVSWIFETKAVITVESIPVDQAEELALGTIDAGADDFKVDAGSLEVSGPPSMLEEMINVIESSGVKPTSSSVTLIPKTTTVLDDSSAIQTLKLLDKLDDLDDIHQVFTNAEFTDSALEKFNAE